jgi:hypothetical protein
MSTPDSNVKSEKKKSKTINFVIGAIQSPTAVGICITMVFLFITSSFYKVRDQNEEERFANQFISQSSLRSS